MQAGEGQKKRKMGNPSRGVLRSRAEHPFPASPGFASPCTVLPAGGTLVLNFLTGARFRASLRQAVGAIKSGIFLHPWSGESPTKGDSLYKRQSDWLQL